MMNLVQIAGHGVYLVVYTASLVMALSWPRGRGRNLLIASVALWMASTGSRALLTLVVMTNVGNSGSFDGVSYQVLSLLNAALSLAGIAVFLVFVIVMRHDLNDLRYRAEDAEARASLHERGVEDGP